MASSTTSTSTAQPPIPQGPSAHTYQRARALCELIKTGYPKGCEPLNALKLRLEIDPNITLCPPLVHLVAQKMDLIALRIFLEKGAFCDIPDIEGNTPLKFLTQKIIERPGDIELRQFICTFIERGARLNAPNKKGETPLSDILLSGNEFLFRHCIDLEVSWADAFITLCKRDDETGLLLVPRLDLVLAQTNVRNTIINELLRMDFSNHPGGLIFLLRHVLANEGYQPPWLDILRRESREASLRCKLDILKETGFIGPLRNHFFGLKFDQKEEYRSIRDWFEEQNVSFSSTAPIPIPVSSTRTESREELFDHLKKGNSWSHQSPPKHPLRQRGISVNSVDSMIDPERLVKQFEEGNETEKRLAQARLKTLLPIWIVSQQENERNAAEHFLKKNPSWVNRKFDGENLLVKAVALKRYEAAHFLLEHSADANVWGENMETPLHIVLKAKFGCTAKETFELVQHLVARGADAHRMNQQNETPVDLLFNRCDPNLFQLFVDASIEWETFLLTKIEKGAFKAGGASQCLEFLIAQGKVSPKAVSIFLFERTWSEKEDHLRLLLECALKRCEKMEVLEFDALSKDTSEESVFKKLNVLKLFPQFYERLSNFALESSQTSNLLLKLMLKNKPDAVKPDYRLIFVNTDRKLRTKKIKLLMDLELIPESKKGEELATGKPLKFSEAFNIGLLSLAPELSGINWSEQLKTLCAGLPTLTELQKDFLQRALPRVPTEVTPIVTMLMKQDFCRSDPLRPNPFETILEIVIPNCNCVSDEQVNCLLSDKTAISYDRKRAICEKSPDFNKCLSTLLNKKTAAPEEISLRSSSSTRSRHSGHKSSKSLPGSGESSPRRHKTKKPSEKS